MFRKRKQGFYRILYSHYRIKTLQWNKKQAPFWTIQHFLLHFGDLCEYVKMCLLNNSQARQPLTSLHFHSARHRLLTQPPLYQTADDFILLFPWTSPGFVCKRPSCQPCCATCSALPHPQGLTWSRPEASALDRPHRETTNQPFCPVTSAQMCCSPLPKLTIWIRFPPGE